MAEKYPVEAACKATGISRSGYYAHRKKPERATRKGDAELRPKIRQVFDKSRGTYGTPRIRIALAREGKRHGRRRIGRLMREDGLKARNKRQWRRSGTTVTDPALATAPNHLAQVPHPAAPDAFPMIRLPKHVSHPDFRPVLQAAAALDVALGVHGSPGVYLPSGIAEQVDTFILSHIFGHRNQMQMALSACVFEGVNESVRLSAV